MSVTLRPDNLLWLRGQTRLGSRRSVSETLDELISEARADAGTRSGPFKSVAGSIRILASDPGLMRADAAIRSLFSPRTAVRRARGLRTARRRNRRA